MEGSDKQPQQTNGLLVLLFHHQLPDGHHHGLLLQDQDMVPPFLVTIKISFAKIEVLHLLLNVVFSCRSDGRFFAAPHVLLL